MNEDGTGQTRLTAHTAIDVWPSFSPDGAKLVFQSDRDNLEFSRGDIYVMDADGGNVRRLTTSPSFDESPSWSPDGQRIAFLSTRDDAQDNARQVYVMNADGGNQTRLTSGPSVQGRPAWSPDGTKIAFSAPSGRELSDANDIYTVAPAGGEVTRVVSATRSNDRFTQPAWSPDGAKLALTLTSLAANDTDVYVVNADGTGLKDLTNRGGFDGAPAWAPEGAALAFSSTREGNAEIYWMYPDGTGQTQLTFNAATDDGPSWRAGSPCLLTEPGTDNAVALHSVAFTRDPFGVTSERERNLSADDRTRVALFCRYLRLLPGEGASAVTATAEYAQGAKVVGLPVEFVGSLPGAPWLTQVNVRLPAELDGAGDVRVGLSLRGAQTNRALVRVAAGAGPQ